MTIIPPINSWCITVLTEPPSEELTIKVNFCITCTSSVDSDEQALNNRTDNKISHLIPNCN